MRGGLDHLEGHELLICEVPAEPHSGEVAPTQLPEVRLKLELTRHKLPDDVVSVVKQVPDLDWVVSPLLVVTGGFLLVIVRPEDLFLLLFLLGVRVRQK